MNILFITRKYPPSIGGMEKFSHHINLSLSKISNLRLISWGGSQKWLPLVLPYLFIKSFKTLLTEKIDVIYVGDSLLSPLGVTLKKIFKKKVVVTAYGLDIIWPFKPYQTIVPRCLSQLDKIICISQRTKDECMARGINKDKLVVVPVGVEAVKPNAESSGHDTLLQLSKKTGVSFDRRPIILSVGRLVERKGVHWFVKNVMPSIRKKFTNACYVIAGDGPEKTRVSDAIKENDLSGSAVLLGEVDDDTLNLLYTSADIFVMPNIPVKGDMEGFGIVALEAASNGLPVVASNLEGIPEAVKDGCNGFLIQPLDDKAFSLKIVELLESNARGRYGPKFREYTLAGYGWNVIAKKYLTIFEEMASK